MPSSTTVTHTSAASGASTVASTTFASATVASTRTGISNSSGITFTVSCPCARAARCFAFSVTLCTTEM